MNAKKTAALLLAVIIAFSCAVVCAAAEDCLTVTASSNITGAVSETYSQRDKTFTVTYCLKTEEMLLDGEWYLSYDPAVLKLNEKTDMMPRISQTGGETLNPQWDNGVAYGEFASNSMYDFTQGSINDNIFITAEFEILSFTGNTQIDLQVFMLSGGKPTVSAESGSRVEPINYIQAYEPDRLFLESSQRITLLSEPVPEPATPSEATPSEATPSEATPSEATPSESTPTEPVSGEPTTSPVPEPVHGDVNCDGEYNIRDAAAIQLYIAQLYKGTFDESVADVNGDGEIGIKDAAYIQLDLAKLL